MLRTRLAGGLLALAMTAGVALVAAPAGAQAACSITQRLAEGRRGSNEVRCLQIALDAEGFSPGPVDGWFGPVTESAVIRYQQAKGLLVDGIVGPQTGGSLGIWNGSARSQSVSGSSTPARAPARASSSGVDWDRLAQCESGGNWAINTGNGYYGGLQFLASTWRAYGGTGLPHQHSRETQIAIAERVRADVGMRAWPGCSRKFGWI